MQITTTAATGTLSVQYVKSTFNAAISYGMPSATLVSLRDMQTKFNGSQTHCQKEVPSHCKTQRFINPMASKPDKG
jgi:hypothetical protein